MENNYQFLIKKLDEFIRKFYKNQLLKGALYFIGLVVAAYLSVVLLEYFGNFNSGLRTGLFYGFLAIAGFCLVKYLIIPATKLFNLGKTISHDQAAIIIGEHFGGVEDKLLNTLQLNKGSVNDELVVASINQRISELQPIPFKSAIDFKENKKYLKLALPPLIVFLLIAFIDAKVITKSTERLVNHGEAYNPESPFEFFILNESLNVVEQNNLELKVGLKGAVSPAKAFIEINNKLYKLDKKSSVEFEYVMRNLQKDETIRFFADGFYSRSFNVNVLPKPLMLNFSAKLDYPSYTGKKDETINNIGDFTVPAGTRISWKFNTKNTESLLFSVFDSTYVLLPSNKSDFDFNARFLKSSSYKVSPANKHISSGSEMPYQISTVPDLFPSIGVEEKQDSAATKQRYFKGNIKDDYGFSQLTFNYRLVRKDSLTSFVKTAVSFEKNVSIGQFFHYWDINKVGIEPGDIIEYFFEVWDNDGVLELNLLKVQEKHLKHQHFRSLATRLIKTLKKQKKTLRKRWRNLRSLRKILKK